MSTPQPPENTGAEASTGAGTRRRRRGSAFDTASRSAATGSVFGTPAPTPRWTREARRRAVDGAVLGVLLALGVLAHGPVFGGSLGYLAAAVGVLAGAAVAGLSAWRGWSRLGTLLAAMVAYLLLGGPVALPDTTIAGVLPSLETFQRLTLLSWQGWRDLLTVALPAGEFEGPAVVPLLTGLATACLGFSGVLRLRRTWLLVLSVLLSAMVLLVVGILWGSHDAPFAWLQGAVAAVVALGWASWRSHGSSADAGAVFIGQERSRAPQLQQVLLAGTALLVSAGAAVTVVNAGASEPDRHVLRDTVVPPLDLHAYPSPLTGFRGLEDEELQTQTLFTVRGLPAGARIPLATMDVYDGNVYNVSETSAAFQHAGSTILPDRFSDDPDGKPTRLSFDIDKYSGVWLPGGGDLRSVEFTGEGAAAQAEGLFHNPATGTTLTTAGVAEGTTYTVRVVLGEPYLPHEEKKIPEDAVGDSSFPMAPSPVKVQAAADYLAGLPGDTASAVAQVTALETQLRADGFYANGNDPASPSYPGHTVTRLTQLLAPPAGQMIGDDEQYATAMALMVRELNLPARVVMGFHPETWAAPGTDLAITGDDAHVWTEVRFAGIGWVPFDPTPDEDKVPQQTRPQPNPRNEPQQLPPPETPQEREPREAPKVDADVDKKDKKNPVAQAFRYVLVGIGILALLLAPFVLIALAKKRRRLKRRFSRRPADRISGGWAEVVDLATDAGIRVPADATRYETAVLIGQKLPVATGAPIAQSVDGHVFGFPDPTDTDVDAVWSAVDGLEKEFRSSVGFTERMRARWSLRSLRRARSARRGTSGNQRGASEGKGSSTPRQERPGAARSVLPALFRPVVHAVTRATRRNKR